MALWREKGNAIEKAGTFLMNKATKAPASPHRAFNG
jgi:hypothetical protein